jgi:hypothetical protein
MNWKAFAQTLAAAAIAGAVQGAGQYFDNPGGDLSLKNMGRMAALGAVLFVLKSPLFGKPGASPGAAEPAPLPKP